MSSTTSGAERTLKYILSGTTYSGLGSYLYIGLSTTTITTGGTDVTLPVTLPVAGRGYSTRAIERNPGNWNITEDGVISNTNEIAFPKATGDWGSVKEIFISIDSGTSASSIQYHQPLIPNIPVNTGTTVVIPAGSLIIKRDSTSYQTE